VTGRTFGAWAIQCDPWDAGQMITAIIPARNEEAAIARCVESVAAQAEIAEVIVVDDGSTDRTPTILAELGRKIPKVKILSAGELPRGWTGKSHAAAMGAEAASGEWLLFTDADTFHYPGSAGRALADAVERDAVLVSYSPEQELETFAEKALVPLVYCRLAEIFSYAKVNNPKLADAAANGQYILILRDVYRRIGGHAAVAREILEDVALARNVKLAGYRIYFTAPIGVVRTRMYRTFGAMWEGWTKNLYLLLGARPERMMGELAVMFPWGEAALLGAAVIEFIRVNFFTHGSIDWAVLLLISGLSLLLRALVKYAAQLQRSLYPVWYIQYYVPGVVLYAGVIVASWWKNTRGRVTWKGREYPAGIP